MGNAYQQFVCKIRLKTTMLYAQPLKVLCPKQPSLPLTYPGTIRGKIPESRNAPIGCHGGHGNARDLHGATARARGSVAGRCSTEGRGRTSREKGRGRTNETTRQVYSREYRQHVAHSVLPSLTEPHVLTLSPQATLFSTTQKLSLPMAPCSLLFCIKRSISFSHP